MKTVAIIPARGGSKRVPGKNIAPFHGKPLIAWTIETALASPSIDRVIVTTDSEEIAEIAKAHGAEVPFIRPVDLANDTMGIEPVLRHTYEWLKEHEAYEIDTIALLFATNPLKLPIHIEESLALFKSSGKDSVVSVTPAHGNNNPHWILTESPEGDVRLFTGESLKDIKTRSQDLPPSYSRNDIVYILKPSNLYQTPPNLYGDSVALYKIDDLFYGDINTPEDAHVTLNKMQRIHSKDQ